MFFTVSVWSQQFVISCVRQATKFLLSCQKYFVFFTAGGNISKVIKYSVIVPTRNRAFQLRCCLSHLSELCFEKDSFEVLIIDNGSTDDTKETTSAFRAGIKNLRYIYCEYPGLVAARHKGFDEASGEILCYIDDDSFVSKNWLRGIDSAFSHRKVALVGGPCLPKYEVEPPSWLKELWNEISGGRCLASLSLLDFGKEVKSISPYYIYGCNFSIRKAMLAKIGGFHPDAFPKELINFRGDGETFVSRKLIELGCEAWYSPLAKIHHWVPKQKMTTDYFYNRAYIQGISDSFTQIRKQYGIETTNDKKKVNIGVKIFHKIIRVINAKLDWKCHKYADESEKIREIRKKMQESHEAGYRNHQEQVKKNPKLLEWILRENYLGENGRLP